MKIESADFFYLSMPQVRDIGDGSQDALLVRVRADGAEGWGECEAAPLVSIASFVCPMSHSACKPVGASVIGERLDDPGDIVRIARRVRENSFDLLQTAHTLSGIEIALWDLLGRRLDEPVYRLLGYRSAHPKVPYASVLFGDSPSETLEKARRIRAEGWRAAKFGWGPFGRGTVRADEDQIAAAREGLGEEASLLVDAGTVWGEDVAAARARLPALEACRALWLEEPFVNGAVGAYRELARYAGKVKLAAGEGCHDPQTARLMIAEAGLGYVQIDTGRIGGIGAAKEAADFAVARGVRYVNHTFTTHLALSASLQPYAGLADHDLCEYPVESSPLARELTRSRFLPDAEGRIRLPDAPGLGIEPDPDAVRRYLVDAEIRVGGRTLYRTPAV